MKKHESKEVIKQLQSDKSQLEIELILMSYKLRIALELIKRLNNK